MRRQLVVPARPAATGRTRRPPRRRPVISPRCTARQLGRLRGPVQAAVPARLRLVSGRSRRAATANDGGQRCAHRFVHAGPTDSRRSADRAAGGRAAVLIVAQDRNAAERGVATDLMMAPARDRRRVEGQITGTRSFVAMEDRPRGPVVERIVPRPSSGRPAPRTSTADRKTYVLSAPPSSCTRCARPDASRWFASHRTPLVPVSNRETTNASRSRCSASHSTRRVHPDVRRAWPDRSACRRPASPSRGRGSRRAAGRVARTG